MFQIKMLLYEVLKRLSTFTRIENIYISAPGLQMDIYMAIAPFREYQQFKRSHNHIVFSHYYPEAYDRLSEVSLSSFIY